MNLNYRSRVGFTMSEVLITLGVIGVVAALTLPSLVQNYQKQATVNKLKKFYTEMNQVLQMARNDNGDFATWTWKDKYGNNSSEAFYDNYIKPYIKNVEKIQTNVEVSCDFTGGVRFVFSDGTQAILSVYQNYLTTHSNKPAFIFYTNAKYYTDVYGKDIKHSTRQRFYFIVDDKGRVVPPYLNESRSSLLVRCNKIVREDINNGNVGCSGLIIKDGWKISNDYPW